MDASNLYIGVSGTGASYDHATNFTQTLNMSGLNNFVFNGSGQTFRAGLNPGASNASKQTNVATITFGNNTTITASEIGFSDDAGSNAGGKTTVNLGQTNIWNTPELRMGAGGRSDLALQFTTGLINPSLKLRGVDGTSALPSFTVGSVNAAGDSVWDQNADVSGGTLDALVSTMVVGLVNPNNINRNGVANSVFTMGKGTLTVNSLKLGQFAGTILDSGTDGTMIANGTFRLVDALGTVDATTILLGDVPTNILSNGTAREANGTLAILNGVVKADSIARGAQDPDVVTTARVDFSGGTIRNHAGANLAINDVQMRLLTNSGTRTIDVTGSNTTTLNAGTVVSDVGSLTKEGTGTLLIQGANTHSGGNIVNAGTLRVEGSGLLSGPAGQLTVNGSSVVDLNGTSQTVGILNGTGGKVLNNLVSTNSILTVGGGDATGGNYLGQIMDSSSSPPADYNQNGVVDAADFVVWRKDPGSYGGPSGYDAWRSTFGSTGGGPGGTLALTKTGLGAVASSGTNTYTGQTHVQTGALAFGTTQSLYNNQQGSFAGFWNDTNIVVESGATLGFGVGGVDSFSNAQINNFLTNVSSASGGFKAGSSVGLYPTVASHTYSSVIGDAAAGSTGFSKLGPNALVLTANNTFTGRTQVYEGTLSVAAIGNVGAGPAPLGNQANAFDATILLGASNATGTLRYTGAGETTDRDFSLAGTTGGGTIDASGTGSLVINGNVSSVAAGAKTLTLAGTNTAANTISSSISDGAATLALSKADNGKWLLSGFNSYNGATTVSGGTLELTGAYNGLGSMTITGGTMKVNGGTHAISVNAGVTDGSVNVATSAGTSGELIVDNSGSVSVPRYFNVGVSGGNGVINQLSGTVTVSGSDDGTPELFLGRDAGGIGTYNLTAGTLQLDGHANIGRDGGTGVFNNSGTVNILNELRVGSHVSASGGDATVNNLSGGSITARQIYIATSGGNTGSSGELVVEAGSTVTVNGPVRMGAKGTAELIINGGTLTTQTNAGPIQVGYDTGGVATLTMNSGTINCNDWVVIGRSGSSVGYGFQHGGTINTALNFSMAQYAPSVGYYTMDESNGPAELAAGVLFNIGDAGTATFNLNKGKTSSGDWTYVGDAGTGTFNIGDGTHTAGDNFSIGTNVGAVGVVNMTTSANAEINVTGTEPSYTGNLVVGDRGTGTLNISTGTINLNASLTGTDTLHSASYSVANNPIETALASAQDGNLSIAEESGTGLVDLSGTGLINVSANVFVGGLNSSLVGGKGTLSISGGQLKVGLISPDGGDLVLGSPAPAPNASVATVNLSGGVLDVTKTDGTETYGGNISSGGAPTVTAFNFTGGTLKARYWNRSGPFGGDLGNLKQNGSGSLLDITDNNLTLLQNSSYDLGTGTATIGSGRTFAISNGNVLNSAGAGIINVGSGGTLDVGAGSINVDTLHLDNGTAIAGAGVTVNAALTAVAGGVGIGTINGDLTYGDDNILTIELNGTGAGQFDEINASGVMNFDGDLQLVFLTAPTLGDTFDVFNFSSSTGMFDNILAPFGTWTVDSSTGVLTYAAPGSGSGSGSGAGASIDSAGAVPEPTAFMMLAIALAGFAGSGMRRR